MGECMSQFFSAWPGVDQAYNILLTGRRYAVWARLEAQ